MKHLILVMSFLCIVAAAPAQQNKQDSSDQDKLSDWKVLTFLNMDDKSLALVNIGQDDGVKLGHILKSYRKTGDSGDFARVNVETGRLQIVQVGKKQSLARVYVDGNDLSKASFPNFPGVMAHDYLSLPTYNISKITQVIPEIEFSFFDLFKEPKRSALSFELLEEGMDLLRNETRAFADRKVGFLLVTGHTDHNGLALDNQIESYERALTVKQFLVNELGFDAERVLALGFGENEPKDRSSVAGYIRNNRRIVIKTIVDKPRH